MNSVKRLVGILMAVILVTFALPSVGAPQYTKQYSLTLTSSPSAPLTVVAHLTNQALAPGNSNIGSFRYTFTGATIDAVATKAANPAIPPANIQVNGSSIFVALGSPIQSQQTNHLTIVLNDCGDGIFLHQSGVQVWTGNMGQPFSPIATTFPVTTSVVCGDIACGETKTVPDSIHPVSVTRVTIKRSFYDKDGISTIAPGLCETLPYTVTNIVPTSSDKLVHLAYPIAGDPAAAFELKVIWPGDVPAVGATKVAWLNTDGSSTTEPGTPDFIVAIPCNANANFLPVPYGTLKQDVLASDATIRVNTTIPLVGLQPRPAVPFDIVVGPEPDVERMTVTSQGGPPDNEIWHVTRGVANVGTGNAVFHPAVFNSQGVLAMSEPLPIMTTTQGGTIAEGTIGQYAAGNQAQVCIKGHALETSGHSTTYIVVGDPWASQP